MVRATWNPETSALPTPTDLVRDAQTGRLATPITEEMPAAEQQWRRWLNTLDGYPTASTLTIPVDGPIDDTTLRGKVILAARDADGVARRVPLSIRYDADRGAIIATPTTDDGRPTLLRPDTQYTYGVWGYTSGLRGRGGEQVVADSPFYFVRGDHSLRDHPAAVGDAEATEALETLRLRYQPIFAQLADVGLPQDEVAVAGDFTTSSAPTLWFDPTIGEVPLPNDLLRDPHTGIVHLPITEGDSAERHHVKEALSRYDGFSTTGAITFEADTPVDRASALATETVRLFRVGEQGDIVEHTRLTRGVLDDDLTVWIQPELALEPDHDYVVVVSRNLRDAQTMQPFRSQPIGALLRLDAPLVEADTSQVANLSGEQAALLEPARRTTRVVLDHLRETEGVTDDDVSLAYPFHTIDAPGYLMGWRAMLFEEQTRTDVVNVLARTPVERGLPLVMPDVGTIVTGQLTTLNFLAPETLAMREDGEFEERLINFTLIIPESATPGEPIPTVVFGHGLATSRELLYLIAQKLADAGFAAISVDLPLHGERSVCLRETDCRGDATCNARHECIDPDGSPGELNRISSPFPDGPTYPTTSGEPFLDLEDIEASRDHFTQAIIDLCQLVRVTRGADWGKATGGYVLNGDDMMYLGMSLGGILGSNLTVVEPTLETYVLNVPGAGFLEMVENSGAFSTTYEKALSAREIMRDTDAYFTFQNIVRWMLDPVDPINLVQYAVRQPLTYTDPADGTTKTAPTKRVMIQMAEGDVVVPNITTELLSARSGIDYRRYTPTISNHAFLFDPTSGEGRRAREDMVEFFEDR